MPLLSSWFDSTFARSDSYLQRDWMPESQHIFKNPQNLYTYILIIITLSLLFVNIRQAGNHIRRDCVPGSQYLYKSFQCSFIQQLCIIVFPLVEIEFTQAV